MPVIRQKIFLQYTAQVPLYCRSGKKADKTDAEVAFYIVSRVAGEGSDRFADKGDYYLREEELQMLADVCQYHRDVIVVVNTGGLVDLSFMDTFKNICGLLQIVQPGMEEGMHLQMWYPEGKPFGKTDRFMGLSV